jgi:hypothetical protein
MSIIESLYQYFLSCPLLSDHRINIDFLPADQKEYSIEPSPSETIVKRYTDGSSIRQYQFLFSSREFYSSDIIENLKNSSFYEQFSNWIEKESRTGNLPVLPDGMQAQSIEALTQGYTYYQDTSNARYQIQCKLTYFQQ